MQHNNDRTRSGFRQDLCFEQGDLFLVSIEYTPPVTTDIGSGIAEAIEAAKKNTQTKPKRGQKKKKGTKIAF